MKLSLSWLREYFPHELDPQRVVDALIYSGVEVEKITRTGVEFAKVIVAQIESFDRHPNADRLSVCRVNDGSDVLRQIVCGAANFRAGDKVALALPGAVLPKNFRIKASKIRGIESEGMLCSARELGIAEDAAGILILPSESIIGEPLGSLFPSDIVLDLEITPDRPDLLSYRGIARELTSIFALPSTVEAPIESNRTERVRDQQKVRIEDNEACPLITFRAIHGVQVGASPEWLKRRLESSGLRSINNIVDATNYAMLEMGKPLHAYDLDAIEGGLEVRFARLGETLVALDGQTYALKPRHLVIADNAKVLGLAGVMGGEATGVTGRTTSVLLESALFSAPLIRAMSRELNLISDASYRFERGVDPLSTVPASDRCAHLIHELAQGKMENEVLVDGEEPRLRKTVQLRKARCAQLLGTAEPDPQSLLPRAGLQEIGPEMWLVPSYRLDLHREVDLVEEVCRIFGVQNIGSRTLSLATPSSIADHQHDDAIELRGRLVGLGLYEARSLALIDEESVTRTFYAPNELLRLKNPLAEDQKVLRPSLIPGLVRAAARNFHRNATSVSLFELGKVFQKTEPEERQMLGIIVSGQQRPKSWEQLEVIHDFFSLKGFVAAVSGEEIFFRKTEPSSFMALICRLTLKNGTSVGYAGQVRPGAARDLGARDPVFVAELDLQVLPWKSAVHFRPLDRYPPVTRDVAFIVDEAVQFAVIKQILQTADEPLLSEVKLFDLFVDLEGIKVPAGQKSMAFSLTYRAPDRTLTQDEANAAHQRLKDLLMTAFGVRFRE
jgi:phenylalanyl-tRNA synthetase beta chain